ncbi:MAG: hypothetical protein R6X25_04080 [Candidatus Krumholzibacteriia bacterium]
MVRKVALFGISLLGALVALDVYLQVAEIQTPMETRIDPVIGPTYIPDRPIVRFNEGFYIGGSNEYGYLGELSHPEREGDEKRILLIGDSFVLGHTVFDRHHFGRIIERDLGLATGEEVKALNFGKADFNLWNMYQYYCDFAAHFEHDLALFFFQQGDLAPTRQLAGELYPTCVLEGDSIRIDRSFVESEAYRQYRLLQPLLSRSAVLRLAFNTHKMILRGELEQVVLGELARFRHPPAQPYTPPVPKRLPDLSRKILEILARDPRNVFVLQKDLDPGLRSELEELDLPLIDLGARLAEAQEEGFDPYYWPVTGARGHWNNAAHVLIGEFLARELFARGHVWPAAAGPDAGDDAGSGPSAALASQPAPAGGRKPGTDAAPSTVEPGAARR